MFYVLIYFFLPDEAKPNGKCFAGNTLRKWQRCNFLELDTDWATRKYILYKSPYRGHTQAHKHTYVCRGEYVYTHRFLCIFGLSQRAHPVWTEIAKKKQKENTTMRHNVFYFIIMNTTCLCMYVHGHTICVHVDIPSRFCWCQQRDAKCLGTELRL